MKFDYQMMTSQQVQNQYSQVLERIFYYNKSSARSEILDEDKDLISASPLTAQDGHYMVHQGESVGELDLLSELPAQSQHQHWQCL